MTISSLFLFIKCKYDGRSSFFICVSWMMQSFECFSGWWMLSCYQEEKKCDCHLIGHNLTDLDIWRLSIEICMYQRLLLVQNLIWTLKIHKHWNMYLQRLFSLHVFTILDPGLPDGVLSNRTSLTVCPFIRPSF